jgi:hypothetical protein
MRRGQLGELGQEAGVEDRIVKRPLEPRIAAAETATPEQARLDSLPARVADVGEVAAVGDGARADEQDVVVVGGAEARHDVVQRRAGPFPAPAHAQLERSRDDWRQRRIGDEAVGQPARIGLAGTGQLQRRRHTHRFAVTGVGADRGPRLIADADGRVQPLERMIAAQRAPEPIRQRQRRDVEAHRRGHEQIAAQRQRVSRVQAQIATDAVDRDARRRVDDAAGDRPVVGLGQARQRRGRVEGGAALACGCAGEQVVLAPGDGHADRDLRRGAVALLARARRVLGRVVRIVRVKRDRIAGVVDHQRLGARRIGRADEARLRGILAGEPVRLIAVQRRDPAGAIMRDARQLHRRRQRALAARNRHEHAVVGDVGVREDRPAVLGQQLARRRAVAPQRGVGGRQCQLGRRGPVLIGAGGERARGARRRERAPALLPEGASRREQTPALAVAAQAEVDQTAAERSAQQVNLRARIGESRLGFQ